MPVSPSTVTQPLPGPGMKPPPLGGPMPGAPAAPAMAPMAPMPPQIPGMVPGKGPVSSAVNQRLQQNAAAAAAPAPAAPAAPAGPPMAVKPPITPPSPIASVQKSPGGSGAVGMAAGAGSAGSAGGAGVSAPAAKTAQDRAMRRAEILSIFYKTGSITKMSNLLAEQALLNLVPRLFSKGAMLRMIKCSSNKYATLRTIDKLHRAFEKAALDLDISLEDPAIQAGARGAAVGGAAGGAFGLGSGVRELAKAKEPGPGMLGKIRAARSGQSSTLSRLKDVISQKGVKNVMKFLGKKGLGSALSSAALGGAAGVGLHASGIGQSKKE